ncbi:hypothetical protein, partial [Mesorhizobium sp. M0254]|uniref:hypothetical protein n=1 Tax=Mesorhizobium sp. M0254 TaxID=2956927 RepID=UPI00333E0505
ARAQEARSTPSRMTSFMIAHFAELDAHNQISALQQELRPRWPLTVAVLAKSGQKHLGRQSAGPRRCA